MVYKRYMRELYKGFIAEIEGNLESAEYHYKNCLQIPVYEEASYYTLIDLSRIYLKNAKPKEAEDFLWPYIDTLSMEILRGAGIGTILETGYAPSKEALSFMEEDKRFLEIVLKDLRNSNNTFVESFRDDPSFFRRLYGYKRNWIWILDNYEIDRIASAFPTSHQSHIMIQLQGFLAEKRGNIDSAIYFYQECFKTDIEMKQNYYTNIDLARVFLKNNQPGKAEHHLKAYIRMLSEEIMAVKGEQMNSSFGQPLEPLALDLLKEEQEYLNLVLEELIEENNKNYIKK
jgi:hypothetical protein